jgi:hypothetical protein
MRTERRTVSTLGTLNHGNVRSDETEAILHLARDVSVDWHGECEVCLPWSFREAWDRGEEIEFSDCRGNSVRLVGGTWNPITGDAVMMTTGHVSI